MLVFGAIRLHSIGVFGSSNANKKKNLINEENPQQQLEWDDSGLNIIENPLETFEVDCFFVKLSKIIVKIYLLLGK